METPINTTTTTPTKKPANSTTTASPAAPASTPAPAPPVPTNSVTISIEGPNGTIVGATKVTFDEGATVLDILTKVTSDKKIPMETSYNGTFVDGIDIYYAGDDGGTSGWIYKLNGVMVSQGAAAVKVKDGDRISWIYTTG